MTNLELDLDLDLDIDTDLIDVNKPGEQSLSYENTGFTLPDDTDDIIVICSAIKDFYYNLQKQSLPEDGSQDNSYMQSKQIIQWFNKVVSILNYENNMSFDDLIQLIHILRLTTKFLNNIVIKCIKKNLNYESSLDLSKIFDIIDDQSLDFKVLISFSNFLIHNTTFNSTNEFLNTIKQQFNVNVEKLNLISLQITDVTFPIEFTFQFKEIFKDLFLEIVRVNKLLLDKISAAVDVILPNIKKLLNNRTDVILFLFSITKTIENLIKMNHKTLAGIGKSNKNEESGYLYKRIETIFPTLIENKPLLNDIQYNKIKMKTVQRLANKVILLSRVDYYKGSPKGHKGEEYYKEMIETINKWIENDRPKLNSLVDNDLKPLPIPKDNNYVDKKNRKGKRRAGKKLTKYRHRFQHTGKLDKLKNQLEFGKKESFVDGKDQYMDDMDDNGLGMAADKYKKLLKEK
ncbi:hypothetical protein ACO0R3_003366 [Hanseniaspora guilliermondii]